MDLQPSLPSSSSPLSCISNNSQSQGVPLYLLITHVSFTSFICFQVFHSFCRHFLPHLPNCGHSVHSTSASFINLLQYLRVYQLNRQGDVGHPSFNPLSGCQGVLSPSLPFTTYSVASWRSWSVLRKLSSNSHFFNICHIAGLGTYSWVSLL